MEGASFAFAFEFLCPRFDGTSVDTPLTLHSQSIPNSPPEMMPAPFWYHVVEVRNFDVPVTAKLTI